MITSKYKSVFNRIFEIPAKFLIGLGLNANQVTILGLLLGLMSCVMFVMVKNVPLFCVLILLTGLFDAMDGSVARLSGRVTKFGSYLDAICDRIFDGAVMLSVAVVTGHWIAIFVLLLGSFLVSYAKARAAIEVSVSNTEWPDFMERAERAAFFWTGFLLSDLFKIHLAGHTLFFWTLLVLNGATYFTVFQRVLRAKSFIEKR